MVLRAKGSYHIFLQLFGPKSMYQVCAIIFFWHLSDLLLHRNKFIATKRCFLIHESHMRSLWYAGYKYLFAKSLTFLHDLFLALEWANFTLRFWHPIRTISWMMNERIADLRGRYHQNIPSRELTYPQAAGTFEDDVLLSLTKMGIYVSFQEFTAVFFSLGRSILPFTTSQLQIPHRRRPVDTVREPWGRCLFETWVG